MKKIQFIFSLLLFTLLVSCKNEPQKSDYFTSNELGLKNGGVKMISIQTPKGKFNIQTNRSVIFLTSIVFWLDYLATCQNQFKVFFQI